MSSYNPLFERLVGDDDTNLERLLAYATYKREKYKWTAYRKAQNRPPTDADKAIFVEACEQRLDDYFAEAAQSLDRYAQVMVEGARPQIEREAVAGRIERAVHSLENWSSFWKQVGTGIVAWLSSLLILMIASWGAARLGIDIIEALK